VISYVISCRFP